MKYLKEGCIFMAHTIRRRSTNWNFVLKALEWLEDGFTLKIGGGQTSFWHQSWILKSSFCMVLPV